MEAGDINHVRLAGEGPMMTDQTRATITPYADEKVNHQLDIKASNSSDDHDEEKVGVVYEVEATAEDAELPSNLYPFPELENTLPEKQQFTVRAVFVGCCLGAVVSASNICKNSEYRFVMLSNASRLGA